MYARGSVQGAAARRFPDYCYRKPVMRPLSPHGIDPNRLCADSEFPRDTAIYLPALEAVDLCDYEFTLGPTGHDGLAEATVYLVPNEYSQSKERRAVLSAKVSHGGLMARRHADEMIRKTFA
jgi:hypothetical protein